MAAFKRWRREHQPVNEPSCGSVFVNPAGDSAGRLIDAAGLKGHRVGGAEVSRKHANFITVSPAATAGDVATVIGDVRRAVADRWGVVLEPEVVMAGFAPLPDLAGRGPARRGRPDGPDGGAAEAAVAGAARRGRPGGTAGTVRRSGRGPRPRHR
jgi:hypothetical protein